MCTHHTQPHTYYLSVGPFGKLRDRISSPAQPASVSHWIRANARCCAHSTHSHCRDGLRTRGREFLERESKATAPTYIYVYIHARTAALYRQGQVYREGRAKRSNPITMIVRSNRIKLSSVRVNVYEYTSLSLSRSLSLSLCSGFRRCARASANGGPREREREREGRS